MEILMDWSGVPTENLIAILKRARDINILVREAAAEYEIRSGQSASKWSSLLKVTRISDKKCGGGIFEIVKSLVEHAPKRT